MRTTSLNITLAETPADYWTRIWIPTSSGDGTRDRRAWITLTGILQKQEFKAELVWYAFGIVFSSSVARLSFRTEDIEKTSNLFAVRCSCSHILWSTPKQGADHVSLHTNPHFLFQASTFKQHCMAPLRADRESILWSLCFGLDPPKTMARLYWLFPKNSPSFSTPSKRWKTAHVEFGYGPRWSWAEYQRGSKQQRDKTRVDLAEDIHWHDWILQLSDLHLLPVLSWGPGDTPKRWFELIF